MNSRPTELGEVRSTPARTHVGRRPFVEVLPSMLPCMSKASHRPSAPPTRWSGPDQTSIYGSVGTGEREPVTISAWATGVTNLLLTDQRVGNDSVSPLRFERFEMTMKEPASSVS
jgi:hypothetical protein